MVLNTAYWPDWLKIIQVFEQVFRTVSVSWNIYFSKVIATFPSPNGMLVHYPVQLSPQSD